MEFGNICKLLKFIQKKIQDCTLFCFDDTGKISETNEKHILDYLEKRYMQGEIYVRNISKMIQNNHTEPHFIHYSLQIMRN